MTDYESVTDQELQQRAVAKGLFISTDKNERWYLTLLNPPPAEGGAIDVNPRQVMASLVREEIVRYVFEHEGEHRSLSPREIMERWP